MRDKPLISILIPTYNRPKYLSLCLDTVLSQKGFEDTELELIISDNSEWNETKDLIQNYIKIHPTRNITYSKNKNNLWMISNWNKLLRLANGDFFIFLSDDDLFFLPKSLSTIYSSLQKESYNAVFGLRKTINSSWKIISSFQKQKWVSRVFNVSMTKILWSNQWGFWGILYKNFKSDFYDDQVWIATDWDFNISYIKKHGKYWYVNDYTFLYRIHTWRMSEVDSLMSQSEKKIILKWHNSILYYYIFRLRRFVNKYFLSFIVRLLQKVRIYNFIRKFI